MVIAPGRDGITAFVILQDDECLPTNLNDPKVVVMRRGPSTNWQIMMVKEFGRYADEAVLRPRSSALCDYLERIEGGNPIHEHKDGKWWFYEENWEFESGPFDAYEIAYAQLNSYCIKLEETKRLLAEAAQPQELEIDIEQAKKLLNDLNLKPEDLK